LAAIALTITVGRFSCHLAWGFPLLHASGLALYHSAHWIILTSPRCTATLRWAGLFHRQFELCPTSSVPTYSSLTKSNLSRQIPTAHVSDIKIV